MKQVQLIYGWLFISLIFLSSCSQQAHQNLTFQPPGDARPIIQKALHLVKAITASLDMVSAAQPPDSVSLSTTYSLMDALTEMDISLFEQFKATMKNLVLSPDISEFSRAEIAKLLYLLSPAKPASHLLYGTTSDFQGSIWTTLAAVFEQNVEKTERFRSDLALAKQSLVDLSSLLTLLLEQLQPVTQCFSEASRLAEEALAQCNRTCTSGSRRPAECFLTLTEVAIPNCLGLKIPKAVCGLRNYFPGHFGSCPGQERPNPNDPDTDCTKWDDVEHCLGDAIRCAPPKVPRKVYLDPAVFLACLDNGNPSSRQVGNWVCIDPQAPDPVIPYPRIGERYPTFPTF